MQVQTLDGRLVTLAEVRDVLEKEQADRKEELSYEQKLALEHAKVFGRIHTDQALSLLKDIRGLGVFSEESAHRLVDTLPTNADDLRAVLHKDKTNLSKEQVDKVIELVLAYKK